MSRIIITALAIVLCSFCARASSAQSTARQCRGPIYTEQQLTRPARITRPPDLQPIYRAFGNGVSIHAVVDAILCRSGSVTDINVVEVSPAKVKDFIVGAVYLVRFTPAEMNWHTASQRRRFEFDTGLIPESDTIDAKKAQGRLIEAIDIIGNRKLTKEQILSWIHSRVGEPYDVKTVNDDLLAILHSGLIDAQQSRVTLEDGLRGGVIIHFEVAELPTIVAIKFSGLKAAELITTLNSLVDRQADIRLGAPLDSAKLQKAVRVITDFLESKGWREVKVNVQGENLSATEVSVTFAIAGYKFQ